MGKATTIDLRKIVRFKNRCNVRGLQQNPREQQAKAETVHSKIVRTVELRGQRWLVFRGRVLL